jgi:2-dehydropantoate 2-reductase
MRLLVADVPVVTLQNGLQADRLAAHALGRDADIGVVVMAAAEYLRPGEVSVLFPGWLVLGEVAGPLRPRTRAIARVLRRALPTYLTDNLMGVRWTKLIANLNNAVCAATGLALPEIAATSAGRAVSVGLMREGAQVARAAGIRLDHSLYGRTWRSLREDHAAALVAVLQSALPIILPGLPPSVAESIVWVASRSRLGRIPVHGSTWQSIARGRPTEIDYLNGEIIRLGQEFGVPTPYNTRAVAFVHEAARARRCCALDDLIPTGTLPLQVPDVSVGAP